MKRLNGKLNEEVSVKTAAWHFPKLLFGNNNNSYHFHMYIYTHVQGGACNRMIHMSEKSTMRKKSRVPPVRSTYALRTFITVYMCVFSNDDDDDTREDLRTFASDEDIFSIHPYTYVRVHMCVHACA